MNYITYFIIAASIGITIANWIYIYSTIKQTYKKRKIEQYKLMNYASNFLEHEIIYIQLLLDDKETSEVDKRLLRRFLEEYEKDFKEIQLIKQKQNRKNKYQDKVIDLFMKIIDEDIRSNNVEALEHTAEWLRALQMHAEWYREWYRTKIMKIKIEAVKHDSKI